VTENSAQAPSSYPPPAHFVEQANAREELYHEAEKDRLAFWAKQADRLSWAAPFTEVQLRGPPRRSRQR
jgi:acetyl-CoA synthetase